MYYTLGKFSLRKRPKNKKTGYQSPNWCIRYCEKQQNKYISLGTSNHKEAKALMDAWYRDNFILKKQTPDETTIGDVIRQYYNAVGINAVSADSISRELRLVSEMIETIAGDIKVEEYDIDLQDEIIKCFTREGKSPGYIRRIMTGMKTAIHWAKKRKKITSLPDFTRLPMGTGSRDYVMTIEEMARLWDAAEWEHLQIFIMLLICTWGRPNVLFQLTPFACDLKGGSIKLHPKGKPVTKKRNAIVPMCQSIIPLITSCNRNYLIEVNGKPVKSLKRRWNEAREMAGLSKEIVPYAIRHTMPSLCAMRGVPDIEISTMMGHVKQDTTARHYIHCKPEHMKNVRDSIDSIVYEIGRAATRPTIPLNPVRSKHVLVQ